MLKKYLKKVQQLQLKALGTDVIVSIANYCHKEDGAWFCVWLSLNSKKATPIYVYFCGPDWATPSGLEGEFDAKIAAIEGFIKKYSGDDRS